MRVLKKNHESMRNRFEDPISGIILAIGACFGSYGLTDPDSVIGITALVIQSICLGLFIFRFIRMWMNREYNPPTRVLPALKFTEAIIWMAVVILWWDEANGSDDSLGIGLMILLMIMLFRE